MNRLAELMKEIEARGLTEIAKQSPAYETAMRIAKTGKDLECNFEDLAKDFEEDVASTSRVLSNPLVWGISDPAWKDFCKEWNDGRK